MIYAVHPRLQLYSSVLLKSLHLGQQSHTRDTSRFYQYWLDHVDEDIAEVKHAINNQDFKHLGEVFEANGLRMHATRRMHT